MQIQKFPPKKHPELGSPVWRNVRISEKLQLALKFVQGLCVSGHSDPNNLVLTISEQIAAGYDIIGLLFVKIVVKIIFNLAATSFPGDVVSE